MAKLPESLVSSIKGVFGGKNKVETKEKSTKPSRASSDLLKITAKNFMALSGMARDLNVASQNVKELVKVMGGKPKNSADMFMLKESEREEKLGVELEKLKPKESEQPKKPSLLKKGKKTVEKIKDLKKQFSENAFAKAFAKYFSIAAILGVIFLALKDTFIEWVSTLWETFKEKFNEFVADIKKWFNEVVMPIVDKVKEFVGDLVDKVKDFFGQAIDWVKEKIENLLVMIEPIFAFVGKLWDKVKGVFEIVKKGFEKIKAKPGETGVVTDKQGRVFNELTGEWEGGDVAAPTPPPAPIPKKEDTSYDRVEASRLARQKQKEPEGVVRTETGAVVTTGEGGVLVTEAPTPPAPAPVPPPKPAPVPPPKPAPVPAPIPVPEPVRPTPQPTKPAGAPTDAPTQIINELNNAGITSKKAQANILANVAKESNFEPISENLDKWSAQTLFRLYGPPGSDYTNKGQTVQVPQHKNKVRFPTWESAVELVKKGAEAIGDVVYGGRMGNKAAGEGYKYRGRGYIQLTGKEAYEKIGKAINVNLVSDPDKVNDPSIAAKIVPAFFLKFKGKRPEDLEDINKVNELVGAADPKSLEKRVTLSTEFETKLARGESIQTSSTQVASGQRQQQKPQTPVVVNAPVTNTKVVQNNQVAAAAPKKDTGQTLAARAA